MANPFFFALAGLLFFPFGELSAAQDCAAKALLDAKNKCRRLCPAACEEPLNRPSQSQSREDCISQCRNLCDIGQESKTTSETTWITRQAIEDYHRFKQACLGNASDKGHSTYNPAYETWQGVSPAEGS